MAEELLARLKHSQDFLGEQDLEVIRILADSKEVAENLPSFHETTEKDTYVWTWDPLKAKYIRGEALPRPDFEYEVIDWIIPLKEGRRVLEYFSEHGSTIALYLPQRPQSGKEEVRFVEIVKFSTSGQDHKLEAFENSRGITVLLLKFGDQVISFFRFDTHGKLRETFDLTFSFEYFFVLDPEKEIFVVVYQGEMEIWDLEDRNSPAAGRDEDVESTGESQGINFLKEYLDIHAPVMLNRTIVYTAGEDETVLGVIDENFELKKFLDVGYSQKLLLSEDTYGDSRTGEIKYLSRKEGKVESKVLQKDPHTPFFPTVLSPEVFVLPARDYPENISNTFKVFTRTTGKVSRGIYREVQEETGKNMKFYKGFPTLNTRMAGRLVKEMSLIPRAVALIVAGFV